MIAYQKLKEHKKAYVLCAVGQNYIDMAKYLIYGLNKYSKYPIILYYGSGNVYYHYDNLILQPIRNFSNDVLGEYGAKFYTTLKSLSTLGAIRDYDIDTVVMLDTDIVVTPYIDNIFDQYSNLIENYPLFLKYSWDIITVMGRNHVSEFIQKYIGGSEKKIPSICSCACIANKNCISFLNDWNFYCNDNFLFNYHYVENKDIYFDFNDEPIANALLWKYNATKYLPCNLDWSWNYKSVKFVYDYYDGIIESLPVHESYNSHYRIPEQYEVPFGLSVIPKNKNNLWGFHGNKDINELNLIIKEIDKRGL